MRLKAEIEISNRTLTIHNRSGRNKKDKHASLAIGRKPQGATQTASYENMSQNGPNPLDFNLFLMVSTAQNRSGTKYAITFGKSKWNNKSNGSNVEKIFDRFIEDGQATVSFHEPAHDLCIKKADSIQLKAFINLIKKIISLSCSSTPNDQELEKLLGENNSVLSALNPASHSQVNC